MLRVVSALAAVCAAHAVGQTHIAYGLNDSVLTVSWATTNDRGQSEVRYGLSPTSLNFTNKGDTRKFTADVLRVWYTRTAQLTMLSRNTVYYYSVGDSENGFSDVFQVTNRRTTAPFRHVLFGDMGAAAAFTLCTACTQHSDVCTAETCKKNTTVGLVSEVDTADMFLHVGDFAYNLGTDDGKLGDKFMENIEQIASRVPYMVSHGNHEDAPSSLAHYIERFRNQPVNSVPKQYVTMNGAAPNTMYFSWNYGLVHYISFSTELFHLPVSITDPAVTKETLLKWMEADLIEANKNRDQFPWILVHGHRPLYSSAFSGADATVRKALEPLFYKYGVDFSINGHQHNYERSYPTYDGKSQLNYTDPSATIYVVSGAAGSREMHTPFEVGQPGWSAFRSNTFGYTRMIVHNASHIHWQQVQTDPTDFPYADYGRVIDDMWIVQNNHGPFSPARAPTFEAEFCPPGHCQSFDHFEPLLQDVGEGMPAEWPLWRKIQEYRKVKGEVAWAKRMEKLLLYINGNTANTAEWEDGLLDNKETKAFAWINHGSQ